MSRVAKKAAEPKAKTSPIALNDSGRTRSRARAIPPRTIRIAPVSSAALSGSSKNTSAIVTETSGAAPTTSAVRDEPASRTART